MSMSVTDRCAAVSPVIGLHLIESKVEISLVDNDMTASVTYVENLNKVLLAR